MPGLTLQVKKWVRICLECGAKKSWEKKRRSLLQQYVVGAPYGAMDILGPLPLTPRGNRYVLLVADYFTKWTESYSIPNQEAATVAEKLVSEFVCRMEFLVSYTVIKGPTLSPKSWPKFVISRILRKLEHLRCTHSQMVRWSASIAH